MYTPLRTAFVVVLFAQVAVLPCRGEDWPIRAEFKNVCVYHPAPDWWALGRAGMRGKVTCQLKINPNNGEVTEVKVIRKTRFEQLNAKCVLTAFKWRFKPNTVTQMPVTFQLEARGYLKEVR
jgi:TonB family protein